MKFRALILFLVFFHNLVFGNVCSEKVDKFFAFNYQIMIEQEHEIKITQAESDFISQALNSKHASTEQFKKLYTIINKLKGVNKNLSRKVEALIGRKLSDIEKKGLSFSKTIGMGELDNTGSTINPSKGFYTDDQIRRKDLVLSTVGFKEKERFEIMNSTLLLNRLSESEIFDFVTYRFRIRNEHAKINNERTLQEIRKYKVKETTNKRKKYADYEFAKAIFKRGFFHKVANLLKLLWYDPTFKLGFCFGRAMTMQLESSLAGMEPDAIKKIYITGKLGMWSFHVASMIKGPDEKWWVLDSFLLKPVELEDWVNRWMKKDKLGNAQIYITNASRMSANGHDFYNKEELYDKFYKGYFRDLIQYYRKKVKLDNGEEVPFSRKIRDYYRNIERE